MNKEPVQMKKELGVVHIFSLASGAMISSGLFVLPAVVYDKAGPSIIIAYIFAGILMIPAMFAKAELATAMPKSGGSYFFIHRSLGPLFGTFAGFTNWFSLSLKSSFALVGIGVFLIPIIELFYPGFSCLLEQLPPGSVDLLIKIIAISFTIIFAILNIFSVKVSGKVQAILVFTLLAILIVYIIGGVSHIDVYKYTPFLRDGWVSVFTVTGMIFISFGGLTKIASVAGEIKNPGKTIPVGMFAAFFIMIIVYALTVFVTVGLLNSTEFEKTLTPISVGARTFAGNTGFFFLAFAAMLAFITTANAGILAASRDPLAMANDNLLPSFFSKVSLRFKTPVVSILITSVFMILVITFLDIEGLVKVASTIMLLLFTFVTASVILMRESKIISYKPSFKAPLYPYLYIAGIVFYIILIIEIGVEMIIEHGFSKGIITFGITIGFFIVSLLWYLFYSKSRARRDSALIHVVERITSKAIKTTTLTDELRDILIERDEIVEDRFDRIIKNATFIDIDNDISVDMLFGFLADVFSKKLQIPAEKIKELFIKREADSSTSIHPGLAIPHIIMEGTCKFDIVVVRSKPGIKFGENIPLVNVIFALAGTKDERHFHLQALMAIAQIVQNKDFEHNWMKTKNTGDLRNLILIAQRVRKGDV